MKGLIPGISKKREGDSCWSRDKLCSGSTIWTNVVHLSIPLSVRASFFIHLRGNTASSDLPSSLATNCFTLACQTELARMWISRVESRFERNEHSPTELIGFVSPPPSFPDPLFRWKYHESRGRSNFVGKRERKRRERFQDCIDNKKGVNWFRRKNINLFGDSGGFIGVVPSGPIPRDERLFLWHRSVFTKWTGYFECAGVYSIRITVSLDCIMV